MHTFVSDFPWILFNLDECQYAISCEKVEAMVMLKEVTVIPNLPEHIRGVINLRGHVIHCVDLRVMMGLNALRTDIETFTEMLSERENDHVIWINELEASVKEHREFKLTSDPHACAFGKWYDNFTTSNVVLAVQLRKFDKPHKSIHHSATIVKELVEHDKYEEALTVIEMVKNEDFREMMTLFSQLKTTYAASRHEIAIIIEGSNGRSFGLIVDEVISVEPIHGDSIESLHDRLVDTQMCKRIGKRRKDNSLVVLLEPELFELEEAMA